MSCGINISNPIIGVTIVQVSSLRAKQKLGMPNTSSQPPISLGKPSLRHRLESYYSLVAPDAITDKEEWKRKFDIIYQKFGGTVEGETKLSIKLAKKYGNRVMLLVAPPHRSSKKTSSTADDDPGTGREKWQERSYEIDEGRTGSRVLDFLSVKFDPFYALQAPDTMLIAANPSIFSASSTSQHPKLDNISKFRPLLPECDPQRLDPSSLSDKYKNGNGIAPSRSKDSEISNKKKPSMFLSMASKFENSGPFSLLYDILRNRQRVRVMVRYVDCIRGTLTGYLVAFDKHFNIIMKDVDEVYSGRVTRNADAVQSAGGSQQSTLTGSLYSNRDGDASAPNGPEHRTESSILCSQNMPHAPSKSKLEAQRRRCYPRDGSGGPGPAIKQRYFHQLLVRGDNVVMVWRAEAERSVHLRNNKSPLSSFYEKDGIANAHDMGDTRVGTPGSLYYAFQRWQNHSKRNR